MSQERYTKVARIIARLNVGGPAKHVVWLTRGLFDAGYATVLIAGTVPEGEADMTYFAEHAGVTPMYIPEMSREISLKDAVTVWKLYRFFVQWQPDIIHTHTAKAGTVGRVAGFLYRWLTPGWAFSVLVVSTRKSGFSTLSSRTILSFACSLRAARFWSSMTFSRSANFAVTLIVSCLLPGIHLLTRPCSRSTI